MATQVGKLEAATSEETGDNIAALENHRLCVFDRKNLLRFLVDTGANISVIPVSKVKRQLRLNNVSYKLFAANGSEIQTYGVVTLELNLNLRRALKWNFVIADVSQPILGADFLDYYKLIVDISARKLIDRITNLSVSGPLIGNKESISTLDIGCPCHDILARYSDITKPINYKGNTKHNVYHYIETTGPPVYTKARPLPPDRYTKVKEEFKHMQEVGICRPSKSEWASPLHVVPKKDGQLRPCGDYRRLNAVTKPDRYPIPRLQDFTISLAGKKIFSRIDCNRAFHNILVNPDDIEKTAIITPFGLFEFPRMTFGLCNAAQTYQRFMDNVVLKGIEHITDGKTDIDGGASSQLFCYIDDILIASEDQSEHKKHLEMVFKRFEEFGLTINLAKCSFAQTQIEFLGYHVSSVGIRPLDDKVKAISDFPRPETVEQMRRFLGMINFYRLHLPNAVKHQAELNKFLLNAKKKDKSIISWDESALSAFEQCKLSLKSAVTLAHPLKNAPLSLMTDASDSCVGAVLQQWNGEVWTPLGFYSKKMTITQSKYSTYDRELLAIYLAIQYFRNQLEGRELRIFTDHKPLTFAYSKPSNDKEIPRRVRQLSYISEYSTDIRHIDGGLNVVADTLSRIESIVCPTLIDFAELAEAQKCDGQITTLLSRASQLSNCQLKQYNVPNSDRKIYCEISTKNIRPYVPETLRKQVFEAVHNISHPGIRATRKMVAEKYFWPGLNKDVGSWAKTCNGCQRSKVIRHTHSELGQFESCERFDRVHIDIIGPLPSTPEGFRYCVTAIDRYTRWPEAFPVATITAEAVAKVIFEGWICRFGSPKVITTDQGRQFESDLFANLLKLLGIKKNRTTPYHPQCNGMIERWHRCLKAAIMARLNSTSWSDELPTVLLGLRAAIRSDSGVSAAQLVFGRGIRLPGDFYTDGPQISLDEQAFVKRLQRYIAKLRPVSTSHSNSRNIFVHPDLESCSHVYIRNDQVRRPLHPPYDGPYEVKSRCQKWYTVQLPNRQAQISIDRLKPAYLFNLPEQSPAPPQKQMVSRTTHGKADSPLSSPAPGANSTQYHPETQLPPNVKYTRSGRIVKPPVRFM